MHSRPRAGRGATIAIAGLLAVGAAACSGGGSTPTPVASVAAGGGSGSPAASGTSVEIRNFAFAPATLTVSVGTTVTWTNNDSTSHSVKWNDGTATSPTLAQGDTYQRTFGTAGTFDYICGIHPSMHGTIVVQ